MKRRKSFDEEGHAHELTFSTYRRLRVFDDPECVRILLESLDRARTLHGFRLWAFVVMPEHVHVLYHPPVGVTVATVLRAIKQPASSRILRHLAFADPALHSKLEVTTRQGHVERRLWQAGGGYDRNVFQEETAIAMIEYIHMNPVRRGLVGEPVEWPWSSHNAYFNAPTPITVDVFKSCW